MKGHERDPRWSRRRRDTCILWSLGVGALVTLLWLTVFMTLLLTTGDQVFRRRYPRLAPHPFALVFGADGASALARKIASRPPDTHESDVASVAHSIDGRKIVVVDGAISEKARAHVADTYVKLTGSRAESGWSREKASDASVEGNAMAKDLPYAECGAGAGLEAVRAIAPHFFDQCSPLRPIWATRCTVYAQNFADVDEAHEDRNHDGDAFSVTAIWYPHERWHPHWGGETVFLSDSGGGEDAELLLPVLPKPARLVMFDSEQPHMSKPPTVIAEPFAPPVLNHVPSTRTQGNRFAVVTRALCGRKTSKELVTEYGTDGYLSRCCVEILHSRRWRGAARR